MLVVVVLCVCLSKNIFISLESYLAEYGSYCNILTRHTNNIHLFIYYYYHQRSTTTRHKWLCEYQKINSDILSFLLFAEGINFIQE